MERVATLIYKLLDQYQNQAGAGKMMMTAQMLLTELQQYEQASANGLSNKVTVVIPTVVQAAPEAADAIAATAPSPVNVQQPVQQKQAYPQYQQYQPAAAWQAAPGPAPAVQQPTPPQSYVSAPSQPAAVIQQPAPQSYASTFQQTVQVAPPPVSGMQPSVQPVQPVPDQPKAVTVVQQPAPPVWHTAAEQQPYHVPVQHHPVQEEVPVEQPAIPSVPPAAPQPVNGWHFDPMHDVPTLSHQETNAAPDINSKAANGEASLNEKLKVEKIELGSVLQESPIRDLRKAIGINDRYLFINELFRGDETMYERSLKTINGFNILPEAQYWIQRELKVKLGWNEQSDTVSHFDQLVRRRFS